MKNNYLLKWLPLSLLLFSCGTKEVKIANLTKGAVSQKAESELVSYLPKIYNNVSVANTDDSSKADIVLLNESQLSQFGLDTISVPQIKESYRVVEQEGKLFIISNDQKGTLFGTYALLDEMGCGFYLTKESLPESVEFNGFEGVDITDSPVVDSRFLFNWHNFISGCTGWNLDDWKAWVDGASKMRYNGIMVHAYGNNPMFSFNYMGEEKATGFFNNTAFGRDWGNQHINDVRRLVGGEIFDSAVYGASVSFADESNSVSKATSMMQDVFSYAEGCGVDVIFAVDLDTWMSNPQNVMAKMPKESLLDIRGYLTPNPETEAGYEYYKNLLKTLIDTYPEVDEFTAWTRSPRNTYSVNLGTIWMAFEYKDFPSKWKKEYKAALKQHPEVVDDLRSQVSFAFSKVVKALQRAKEELGSDVKIGYGSWDMEWLDIMDIFIPKDVPFRPLALSFDEEKYDTYLPEITDDRDVYPIVWAHHDDYAYVGRPFVPIENLTDKLKQRNLKGLGIIHWTTHPLDLYFTSTALQLWDKTANIEYKKVVDKFVEAQFGEVDPKLSEYYNEWAVNGPAFGRETSDHIADLGKMLWRSPIKTWDVLIEPTKKRIAMMEKTPEHLRNDYWHYQRGMEDFYLSFFENQLSFTDAYNLLAEGKVAQARELLENTNPKETVAKYVAAHKFIELTAGEEAFVISLNCRWMVDFDNIKQRVGLQDVLVRFLPTTHDPLAQMPGVNAYDIDKDGAWWIKYWEKELENNNFKMVGDKGALYGENSVKFPIVTMHKDLLPAGKHSIALESNDLSGASYKVIEDGKVIAKGKLDGGVTNNIEFVSGGKVLELEINTKGTIELYSFVISALNK